jgi:hypothetical protein
MAPSSHHLESDKLVFDRSLGKSRSAVVLLAGWKVTARAIPTTVTRLP